MDRSLAKFQLVAIILALLLLHGCADAQPGQVEAEQRGSGRAGGAVIATESNDVRKFVEGFADARVAGSGAESYLAGTGRQAFFGDEDATTRSELEGLLYRIGDDDLVEAHVVAITGPLGPEESYEVQVRYDLASGKSHRDDLFVRRTSGNGLVISGGRTGWEGP